MIETHLTASRLKHQQFW